MGRRQQWEGLDPEMQLRFVADELDRMHDRLDNERAERVASHDKLTEADASNRQVLMGILVSVVVASVMLAVNLAVVR